MTLDFQSRDSGPNIYSTLERIFRHEQLLADLVWQEGVYWDLGSGVEKPYLGGQALLTNKCDRPKKGQARHALMKKYRREECHPEN